MGIWWLMKAGENRDYQNGVRFLIIRNSKFNVHITPDSGTTSDCGCFGLEIYLNDNEDWFS